MDTTPFNEAQLLDDGIFYKGLPMQWDDDHRFEYFVPNKVALTKYKHLVENATLDEWDKVEFLLKIEDWEDDDPETYKFYLAQIPWREKHHRFPFTWGWCLNKETGLFSIRVDADAILAWAGLDKADLIFEVPHEC